MVAFLDDAALAHRDRRLFYDRLVNQFLQICQRIQSGFQVFKQLA